MSGNIIVFANQKGGVGKTTSTGNLGAYLAESGKKVLLIDFDPQGNLSSSMGVDGAQKGIYEVLTGSLRVQDTVQTTAVKNLWLIPSDINLTGANIELAEVQGRESYLKEALAGQIDGWDFVLIDCPPSLGILTLNGLTAAEYVLIPLQCEYFALEGLRLLLQTIRRVQEDLNPELRIGGILFTMFDSRTRLANEIVEEVTSYFKELIFRTIIPRNVRLSEAPSHSVPINLYDPDCLGAKSYANLAREVLERV